MFGWLVVIDARRPTLWRYTGVEPVGTRLKYFVEVKRTRDRVGIEVINQVYGAFALEQPDLGWTLAMIVSLAGFKNTQRFTREQLEARNMRPRNRRRCPQLAP